MLNLPCAHRASVILDVGAGSGFFSRYPLANTAASEAWCDDTGYSTDFDATEEGKVAHFRRSVGALGADLMLVMDVLEHVCDDVGLLADVVSKVPTTTRFLISVPAIQFVGIEYHLIWRTTEVTR